MRKAKLITEITTRVKHTHGPKDMEDLQHFFKYELQAIYEDLLESNY